MGGTSSRGIDESTLTKGQMRKLNALRKSVGEGIAEWFASLPRAAARVDGNAAAMVDTLWPMVQAGALPIPRGGYPIRPRRGRIIAEATKP